MSTDVTKHLRLDPKQADHDAHQFPKPKTAAPHYLRCEWYSGTTRCRLSEGHGGLHEFIQEREREKEQVA